MGGILETCTVDITKYLTSSFLEETVNTILQPEKSLIALRMICKCMVNLTYIHNSRKNALPRVVKYVRAESIHVNRNNLQIRVQSMLVIYSTPRFNYTLTPKNFLIFKYCTILPLFPFANQVTHINFASIRHIYRFICLLLV